MLIYVFFPHTDADSFKTYMTYVDTVIGNLVPNDMQITDAESRLALGEEIRDFYTGGEKLEDDLGDAIRVIISQFI